jgi:outer membrane protein assembly factor BamB
MLAAVAVLIAGCTREPTTPVSSDKKGDQDASTQRTPSTVAPSAPKPGAGKQSDPNAVGAAAEPTYLGKPIGYWIGQARAADPSEDVAKTVEALTLALDSEELSVVVAAADALAAIGPEAAPAAKKLAGLLRDDVPPWIRTACSAAAVAIGEDAVPALAETVRTGPGSAPVRAAIALGSMGPRAKGAIPALEEVLEKSPEDARPRWEGFLAQIDPTRAGGTEPQPVDTGRAVPVIPQQPIATVTGAEDWPGFHGPHRDSICRETGLMHDWPEGGLELLWKLESLGRGYSTIAVAGGKIFTMGDQQRDGQAEAQYVVALDLATREELWATPVGDPHEDGGPRCTPTVDGQLVYALGTDGSLVCLAKETGNVIWRKNLVDDFGGKMMSRWMYSESPLLDDDRLICTPGGDDAAIVALDKLSGEVIWKAAVPELGPRGNDGAAYSSAVVAEVDGVRQYVQLLGRGVVGVEADTGTFLWGYNAIANEVANIPTPVVRGNYVFVTSAYKRGSALLEIVHEGDAFQAKEVYSVRPRDLENHHGGVALVGNHVYAGSGQNRGAPVCLDLATGKVAWRQRPLAGGSASVLYADGHLIFRYDRGLVALVEATPDEFRLKGTFEPETADGPAWPHPVIHDGKLYLRHNELLLCYDVHTSG